MADVGPLLAVIVAPVDPAVILLIDHVRSLRVPGNLVNALPEDRVLVGEEVRPDVLVLELPRLSAVLACHRSHRGDGYMQLHWVPFFQEY